MVVSVTDSSKIYKNIPPVGGLGIISDVERQEFGRTIADIASALGCEQALIDEVKQLIFDNLENRISSLKKILPPNGKAEYVAQKVYASMLNVLNPSDNIPIPDSDKQITTEDLGNFLDGYQKAAYSFAKSKDLAPALQKQLFDQFIQSMSDRLKEWMKRASVISADKPVPIVGLNIDEISDVPAGWFYQEKDGSRYVMMTADESEDPLYSALQDKIEAGQKFTLESFKSLILKDFADHLLDIYDKYVQLKGVFSDERKSRAFENAITAEKKIKIKLPVQGDSPINLTPFAADIEKLYCDVAEFYGEDKLDKLFCDQIPGIKTNAAEDNELSRKLNAAGFVLKECSLETINKDLKLLGEITDQSGLPEANINDLRDLIGWLPKVMECIKNAKNAVLSDDNKAYKIAREWFVQKNTDKLDDDWHGKTFKRNLDLLWAGKLWYEKTKNDKAGIVRPVTFSIPSSVGGRYPIFDGNLVNFNTGYDNIEGSKQAIAVIQQYNMGIGRQSQEDFDILKGTVGIADQKGAKTSDGKAERIFKSISDGKDTWIVIRKPGSTELSVISKSQKKAPGDFAKAKGLLEELLRKEDFLTPEKDFDLFVAASSCRVRNESVRFDPDVIALDATKKLIQENMVANKGVLEKSAKLILKYVSGLNKDNPPRSDGAIREGLSKLESDSQVVELALNLIKTLEDKTKLADFNIMKILSDPSLKELFDSELKAIESFSKENELMTFLQANSSKGCDFLVLNQKFMLALMKDIRNRTIFQDKTASGVPETGSITVSEDESMPELLLYHPILAMRLYLCTYYGGPNPIKPKGSKYEAQEEITAGDIDAFIRMACGGIFDEGKKNLSPDDRKALENVSGYLNSGRVKIFDIYQKIDSVDEDFSRNMNRALELLRHFRKSLARLLDIRDPLNQRIASQTFNGQKPNDIWNLTKTTVKGLKEMPSMAGQTKNPNLVVDAFILALKEQFYSKDGLMDTSINGDMIERFCKKYSALLNNPFINDIVGTHAESSDIKDPQKFLLSVAEKMKKEGKTWKSLNINIADYQDKDVVDAKRLLQAAILLYKPRMEDRRGDVMGNITANTEAALNYVMMIMWGQLPAENNAAMVKSFVLQSKGSIKESKGFSLRDDLINEEVARAVGDEFLKYLNEAETSKDKREIIKSIEEDPMNGFNIEGKNDDEKMEKLRYYARLLQTTPLPEPITFTYSGRAGGNSEIQKGLMIFARSVLPLRSATSSVGEEKKINFGMVLYSLTGGGKIKISKGDGIKLTRENDGSVNPIKDEDQPEATGLIAKAKEEINKSPEALRNEAFYNYINFKFLMSPSINLQMQTALLYQMVEIAKAAKNGDPYAMCDLKNTVENWLYTRAQFVAFQLNPLAWMDLKEMAQKWHNKEYANLLVSLGFYGTMAAQVGMRLGKPVVDRAWFAFDRMFRGGEPIVQTNIVGLLLDNSDFRKDQMGVADKWIPGIKESYEDVAAGRFSAGVKLKDLAFHPFYKISQTALMRRLANSAAGKGIGKYYEILKNKGGGMFIWKKPSTGNNPGMNISPKNNNLFTDPTAEWNIKVSTALKSGKINLNNVKTVSALDVLKLYLQPEKRAHIFKVLGIGLAPEQRDAVWREISRDFESFKIKFETGIKFLAKSGMILDEVVRDGSAAIDPILASTSGMPEEMKQELKKQADLYQAIKNPQKAGSFIREWEEKTRSEWNEMRLNLENASRDPQGIKPVTIENSSFLENKCVLQVRNFDLLGSIRSICDPSVFRGWGMNPGTRKRTLIRSMESIFSTGDNSATLEKLFENFNMNKPDDMARLQSLEVVLKQQKGLRKYFIKKVRPKNVFSADGTLTAAGRKYCAKLLLCNFIQENVAGRYMVLSKSSLIGEFALTNQSPRFISERYRIGRVNILVKGVVKNTVGVAVKTAKKVVSPFRQPVPIYGSATDKAPVPAEASELSKPLEPAKAEEASAPISSLKNVKAEPLITGERFGTSIKGGAVGSFLLSGIISGGDAIIHKKDIKTAAMNTAIGTVAGTAFMGAQFALRSLGRYGSWGVAGAFINTGITGWENWYRIKSLDPGMMAIGLGRVGVGALNGAGSAVAFAYGGAGAGLVTRNPIAVTASGMAAAEFVYGGLTKTELKIANAQFSKDSRSLSQSSADYEISYYFKTNDIKVEFKHPARTDATTKVFQTKQMMDAIHAKVYKDGPFKVLLSASGIKKISADSSADLNISVLDELIVMAAKFRATTGTEEIKVAIKAPDIKKYKEGSIADYTITLKNAGGEGEKSFSCSVVLEGDPVVPKERLMFEKNKKELGLIDVLMSHISIPLAEVEKYPKLKGQVSDILDGAKLKHDIDASVAEMLLLKALERDDVFAELKNIGSMFTGKENMDKISVQLAMIGSHISYKNSLGKPVTYLTGGKDASTLAVPITVKYAMGAIDYNPEVFNPDVLVIQTALNALGLIETKDVNGRFDEATAKALKDGGFGEGVGFLDGKVYRIDEKVVQAVQNRLYITSQQQRLSAVGNGQR